MILALPLKSGYLSSFTHDDGLNTELNNYFKDAINAITRNQLSETEVMTTLQNGISQVISKYKLSGDTLKPKLYPQTFAYKALDFAAMAKSVSQQTGVKIYPVVLLWMPLTSIKN